MINSTEVILYKKKGFDGEKYITLQKEAILQRLTLFEQGRLYLEIGGKFLYDAHAARVLPGFIPESKKTLFLELKDQIEILFCVNANDILDNSKNSDYKSHTQNAIKRIEIETGIKPHLVINSIDIHNNIDRILEFEQDFQRKNYRTWERYKISGYPYASKNVLSDDGFGNDDHIPLTKKLILVFSSMPSAGKTSVCLGQIYNDLQIGIQSGYAKYQMFPVSDLSVDHPINLAYQAARVDLDDSLLVDPLEINPVVTTKDVESFESIVSLIHKMVDKDSSLHPYKTLTDFEINTLASCIFDDEICTLASYEEIKRRVVWYQQKLDKNLGDATWIEKTNQLLSSCGEYAHSKGYSLDQKIS